MGDASHLHGCARADRACSCRESQDIPAPDGMGHDCGEALVDEEIAVLMTKVELFALEHVSLFLAQPGFASAMAAA